MKKNTGQLSQILDKNCTLGSDGVKATTFYFTNGPSKLERSSLVVLISLV
jgi:hypothetical protein